MNLAQRIVLGVTFLIVLGMALFPPWLYIYNPPPRFQRAVKSERPAGYHLFSSGPTIQDQSDLIRRFNLTVGANPDFDDRWTAGLQFFSTRIDSTRLAIQLVVTMLLGGLLYLILRRSANPATH